MIVDVRGSQLQMFHLMLSRVVEPLRVCGGLPSYYAEELRFLWTTKRALIHENQVLKKKQLESDYRLQYTRALKSENALLKKLLHWSDVINVYHEVVRVLSMPMSGLHQRMLIAKGMLQKVYVGQPVLDAHGLIGQVIEVGRTQSTVLLISDPLSAVPVKNLRTHELGILQGGGPDQALVLLHLPKTSQVSVGDWLVTSGLGGRYPAGYPVARVSSVVHVPGEHFIEVRALPPQGGLIDAHLVLLVWPQRFTAWTGVPLLADAS